MATDTVYVCGKCGSALDAVNKKLAEQEKELELYRKEATRIRAFVIAHDFRAYENFARILGWNKRQYVYVDMSIRMAGQRDVPVYYIRGARGEESAKTMELVHEALCSGMRVFELEDDRWLRRHG